jgi:hypothetical protein
MEDSQAAALRVALRAAVARAAVDEHSADSQNNVAIARTRAAARRSLSTVREAGVREARVEAHSHLAAIRG